MSRLNVPVRWSTNFFSNELKLHLKGLLLLLLLLAPTISRPSSVRTTFKVHVLLQTAAILHMESMSCDHKFIEMITTGPKETQNVKTRIK
jgi:hypothetical protein